MKMAMLKTLWATIRQGKIELLESVELPEGTRVLVTLLSEDEAEFWQQASQTSLDTVWNNIEDDVYAQLL
jgi:predicted DNA-binding antitoxin AbrB/MazE fold protein